MKNEKELYVLELGGFGVIDAVFNDINECIYFSCFDFCGLTKDDITFGYRIWQASASREGFKLVPVEMPQKVLDCLEYGGYSWGSEESTKDYFEPVYKAMIEASNE